MSLEEHKRRERAQAIGLFRYQLICPALDEGLSTKQRGKMVREIAARTHTDPFGNQVRISRETLDRWIRRYRDRRVRRAGARAAAAGRAYRRAGAGAGGVAEAGEPDPHRRAGGPDPAHRDRVGAVGVDPAAPFSPAGADGPGRRAAPGGVRPVRGRRPQRAVVRRRAARPAGRRPQDLPVRLPRRPHPAGDRLPVRLRRGHRAAGRRAATGAGRPRGSSRDLRR